jgi:hypothetical protein
MTRRDLDQLFFKVTLAILADDGTDQAKTTAITVLLQELCAIGWDADTIGQFVGDPLVITASRQLERTFWCGHEKHWASGGWSWCDLEFGHDSDHMDEEKRSWTN